MVYFKVGHGPSLGTYFVIVKNGKIDQFQSNDAMLNWGANSENQDLHIWFDSESYFAWIQF